MKATLTILYPRAELVENLEGRVRSHFPAAQSIKITEIRAIGYPLENLTVVAEIEESINPKAAETCEGNSINHMAAETYAQPGVPEIEYHSYSESKGVQPLYEDEVPF